MTTPTDLEIVRPQYTLWTCPPSAWTYPEPPIEITPEMVAEFERLIREGEAKLQERLKPFQGHSWFL